MITKPIPHEEAKNMFIDIALAVTDKVTKVAPEGVLNAVAHGCATLAKKINKDIAIQEAHIFIDYASGDQLDEIALLTGKPTRYSALGSTTYVRLIGDVGTVYSKTTHTFSGKHGIIFELEDDVTIGAVGFAYAKVKSQSTGEFTNVDSLSINKILPSAPTGHKFVLNDFRAQGGRDAESDDQYRTRLKEGVNVVALGTLAKYEQILMSENNNVLRIFRGGYNNGKYRIIVASVNGVDFTVDEFEEMQTSIAPFLQNAESEAGIEFLNVDWYPIDISMRIEMVTGADADVLRNMMQTAMSRPMDIRFWEDGGVINWDDLLFIAKRTTNVKKIFDQYFNPRADIAVPKAQIPRIRGFMLYDQDGILLSDTTGILNPIYFPNSQDLVFQTTII